jgi:hypothetical protein
MKKPALILLTAATLAGATLFAQGQTTADGIGTDAALAGTDFAANWKDETVGALFERIRATMPADNPGSLKRDQVAELVAFILNFNKYPLAQKDLPTEFEALKAIKITAPK